MLENILKSVLSKVPLFLPRVSTSSHRCVENPLRSTFGLGARFFFAALDILSPCQRPLKTAQLTSHQDSISGRGGGRGGEEGPRPEGEGGLDTRRKGGEGLGRAKEVNCIHTSRSLAQWEKGRGRKTGGGRAVGSQFHSSFGYLGRPNFQLIAQSSPPSVLPFWASSSSSPAARPPPSRKGEKPPSHRGERVCLHPFLFPYTAPSPRTTHRYGFSKQTEGQ